MRIVTLLLALILVSAMPRQSPVFICKGGSAYAYHKTEDCRWLQQCNHKIEKVTVKDAENVYKRRPCKPCYK